MQPQFLVTLIHELKAMAGEIVDVQAQQGSDRLTKQECLESLQSSFEKHMTAYEVRRLAPLSLLQA